MERVDGSWFVPPENAHEAEVTPAPTPARAPVDADPAILLEEAGWSVSEAEACLASPALAAAAEAAPAVDSIPVPLPAPSTVATLPLPAPAASATAEARLADLEAAIDAALVTPAVEPPAASEPPAVAPEAHGDAMAEAFFAAGDDPLPAPAPALEDDDEPAWADALDADAPAGPAFETPAGLAAARTADPMPAPRSAPAPDAITEPELDAEPVPAPARTRRAAPGTPPAHPVVRARVASVAHRALAWLVDGAVLVTAVTGTVYAAARLAGHPGGLAAVAHDPLLLGAALAFGGILGLVYVGLFTAAGGQTFGARLAGIRILN